ncbi:hypothetical protein R9X47_13640 [Wukongibacter baidiensis]|uniref:hypothetical protein n=1 Tax=Wukongibacter baidiensis TaxID=1723361 RepID=UPI003D7F6BE0
MKTNYNNLNIRYNGGLGIKIKETETQDIRKINLLLEHIKSYKLRRTFKSEFDVGTLKSYRIILDSEGGGFLHIYTMGYKYIGILDQNGDRFRNYRILKKDLDLDFFNKFFNSLAKENNTMSAIEEENEDYILVDNNGSITKIPITNIPELESYLNDFSEMESWKNG